MGCPVVPTFMTWSIDLGSVWARWPCASTALSTRIFLDGVTLYYVVIAGQEPENPLESAALGPSVEASVAKALGQIAPRDAGAKSEENGLAEQAIVRRRAPRGPAEYP